MTKKPTKKAAKKAVKKTARKATAKKKTPIKKAATRRPRPKKPVEHITVGLPPEVVELARRAVFWSYGTTMASLVAEAIRAEVARREKKRGARYPKRQGEIKTGRPIQAGL